MPGLVRTVHQLSHIISRRFAYYSSSQPLTDVLSRTHPGTGIGSYFGSSDGTSVFPGPFFPIACATSQ